MNAKLDWELVNQNTILILGKKVPTVKLVLIKFYKFYKFSGSIILIYYCPHTIMIVCVTMSSIYLGTFFNVLRLHLVYSIKIHLKYSSGKKNTYKLSEFYAFVFCVDNVI